MIGSVGRSQTRVLIELYEHPCFDRLSTRPRRLGAASLYIGSLLAFPLVAVLTGSYPLTLLILAPYTLAAVLLDGSVRGVTELPTIALDERQSRLRASAFNDAYWFAGLLMLTAGFAAGRLGGVDSALAGGLVLFAIGMLLGAPALLLAWRLPDEPPGDA